VDVVLDVAFIIAATAFFKQQFGLTGKAVLGCVFILALLIGFAPLIGSAFPFVASYIGVLVKVVGLFLAAAGAYDGAVDLRMKKTR
jgi:hypothetical protein